MEQVQKTEHGITATGAGMMAFLTMATRNKDLYHSKAEKWEAAAKKFFECLPNWETQPLEEIDPEILYRKVLNTGKVKTDTVNDYLTAFRSFKALFCSWLDDPKSVKWPDKRRSPTSKLIRMPEQEVQRNPEPQGGRVESVPKLVLSMKTLRLELTFHGEVPLEAEMELAHQWLDAAFAGSSKIER